MKWDRLLNVAFAAAVAFLCARTASDVVRHLLEPLPAASPKRRTPPPRAPQQVARLEAATLSRLTGLPLPVPEPVAEVVEPKFDPNAEPVPTTLRLRLLGTLVTYPQDYSFASIEEVDTRNTSSFMIGDRVQSAELLAIERDRVLLLNNGQREFLAMGGGAPPVAARPSPTPPARGQVQARMPPKSNQPPLGTGIRSTSANVYEVPRTEVDRALSNLNQLAMKARIVPAFKDGKAVGFKLFSIRPNSLYAKIGIQNGDVIRRINGYDLNSPDKALEVYMKLKEAGRIDLELERGGAVVRKTYNIR